MISSFLDSNMGFAPSRQATTKVESADAAKSLADPVGRVKIPHWCWFHPPKILVNILMDMLTIVISNFCITVLTMFQELALFNQFQTGFLQFSSHFLQANCLAGRPHNPPGAWSGPPEQTKWVWTCLIPQNPLVYLIVPLSRLFWGIGYSPFSDNTQIMDLVNPQQWVIGFFWNTTCTNDQIGTE